MYKVVDIDQNTPEWNEWRRGGIGASDIAVIMGVNPYKGLEELYAEKVEGEEAFVSEAMKRGSRLEKYARSEACEYFGDVFIPMCLEHAEEPLFRASLDGLGGDSVLEIKCPTPKNQGFIETLKEAPNLYTYQVQWQLMISGKEKGHLYYYFGSDVEPYVFTVESDPMLHEEMMKAALTFWKDHIEAQRKPAGKIPAIENDLVNFYAEKYQQLDRELKDLQKEKNKLKDLILENAPEGAWQNEYVKCTYVNSVSYDYSAMKKDGIDLEKYKKYKDQSARITVKT